MKEFLNARIKCLQAFFCFDGSNSIWMAILLSRGLVYAIWYATEAYQIGHTEFDRWDSKLYLSIIKNGYAYGQNTANTIVFFPLFPMSFSWLHAWTGGELLYIGMGISFLFFIVGVFALYHYCKESWGESVAELATILMIFNPMTIFFMAAYTESLFFFLLMISLLAMQSKRWVLASFTIGLLAVTRITGGLFFPLLGYELYRNRQGLRQTLGCLLLAGVPLCAFLTFQWREFHTPFAFIIGQKIGWWYEPSAFPWEGLWSNILDLPKDIVYKVNLGAILLSCWALGMGWRKGGVRLWIFTALVLLVVLSRLHQLSTVRYLLSIPMIYIVAAQWLQQKTVFYRMMALVVSSGCMIFFAQCFLLEKRMF